MVIFDSFKRRLKSVLFGRHVLLFATDLTSESEPGGQNRNFEARFYGDGGDAQTARPPEDNLQNGLERFAALIKERLRSRERNEKNEKN